MKKGILLTIEGVEGVGKSTVIHLIRKTLKRRGILLVSTREPGGTYIGDHIRGGMLSKNGKNFDSISSTTELLLVLAGRYQNIKDIILPSMYCGYLILCDRFADTTISYQGAARGLPIEIINSASQSVSCDLIPDKTILLDAPILTSRLRMKNRGDSDRIEEESLGFFQKAKERYNILVKEWANRFITVKASKGIQTTSILISQTLNSVLEE